MSVIFRDLEIYDLGELENALEEAKNGKLNLYDFIKKEVEKAKDALIEEGICPECGGSLKPKLVMTERGTGPFDPNYWPAEYEGDICEDCGEVYD